MLKLKARKKKKVVDVSKAYAALKSQDEIYYQMASIFKAVNRDEDKLAKKVLTSLLTGKQSEIFLENSV
ncbi:hypothetical protein [Desulfobacula sp.]|uniref:hypothetical protein n=1 Tax=Desulfobacula sp. TaxID=2593537 RepID=UPI002604E439|nr:hypothetical protein [Desulfobacula sp.]